MCSGFQLRYQLFLWMCDSAVPPTLDGLGDAAEKCTWCPFPNGPSNFAAQFLHDLILHRNFHQCNGYISQLIGNSKQKKSTCTTFSSRHPSVRTTRASRKYKMKGCSPQLDQQPFDPKSSIPCTPSPPLLLFPFWLWPRRWLSSYKRLLRQRAPSHRPNSQRAPSQRAPRQGPLRHHTVPVRRLDCYTTPGLRRRFHAVPCTATYDVK